MFHIAIVKELLASNNRNKRSLFDLAKLDAPI